MSKPPLPIPYASPNARPRARRDPWYWSIRSTISFALGFIVGPAAIAVGIFLSRVADGLTGLSSLFVLVALTATFQMTTMRRDGEIVGAQRFGGPAKIGLICTGAWSLVLSTLFILTWGF